MALQEIPDFITGGPIGRNLNINMYWEPDTIYGVPVLTSTPGLVATTGTMESGCIRNMLAFNDVLYGVSGEYLCSWTGAGTDTQRGSGLDTTVSPTWVSMAINYDASGNYELAIVDRKNAKIFHYNIGTNTWTTTQAAPDAITPTNITYLKQVFVIGEMGGNRMYCSGADDATSWNATDFSSKTARPDRVVGVMAVNQDLWVFGETSTEIWYYTGAATGFPFALMGGGVLDTGCVSIASVAVMDNSVYWLNDRCEVCRSVGYSYEVISPPILNDLFQGYQTAGASYVNNAIGYTILWEGHPWYCLAFPTPSRTFFFDAAAKAAGQRGWYQWTSANIATRHYGNCATLFRGDWIVGGYTGGAVYYLRDNVYTDATNANYRRAYGTYLYGGGELVRLRKAVLQGSITSTGGATLTLYVNGTNYSPNQVGSPAMWSGLGSSTSLIYYITYYGDYQAVYHKLFMDIAMGRH